MRACRWSERYFLMKFQQLGPYRIGPQLGRGGMGTVFASVNCETNEPAAIKVLAAGLSHEEGFRDRFEAEIETLRKLRHEHIVRLFGYGEQDDVLFYAMELVVGASLDEEIRAGRKFHWREVTEIGVGLCRALKHAHDRGVIHRDIKPANLLLTSGGQVKLSDFGIAKLFGADGMTSAGGVVGTAEFMAPEQADGRAVSHRSDLYSLGAVLYTLLAGRPPFVARSVPELLQMQRFAQPDPIRRHAPETPPELEAIVLQLLEKDPERRVANATVLARRLAATSHGLSQLEVSRAGSDNDDELGSTVGDDDYELGHADSPAEGVGPAGVTRLATKSPPAASEAVDPLGVTQATDAFSPERDGAVDVALEAAPTSRFTAVSEADIGRDDYVGDEHATWITPQGLASMAALLVVGFIIWKLLQPPTAEKLYARIEQQTLSSDTGVVDAKDDIQLFLQHYPNHPRARQMEAWLQDIKLKQLEKNYNLARRTAEADELAPVEIAYLEAIGEAQFNPAAAATKLQALLDLYAGRASGESNRERLCLKLAAQKLNYLRKRKESFIYRQQADLKKQLKAADKFASTSPATARRIWRGMIALHSDKDWAQPMVRQAKAALEEFEAKQPAMAPKEDPLETGAGTPEKHSEI